MNDPTFHELAERLRTGDPGAAEIVFRLYAHRLIGLARNHLDARLRAKFDPEDVAQSALKSFFLRARDGEYDLESWDSLWSLLTVITLRKCGFRVRHFRTAGRDVRKELPAEPRHDGPTWEAIAREPTPTEAAELADVVEGLFRGLDETDRKVLELSLQGCPPADVAREVAVSGRTVYRVLERVKGRLTRTIDDPPPSGP